MFGSSSPFGASTPSPFGGATTTSYPFGSTPPGNPFGTNQASPFGAKPFGGANFGGQTGSSIFGSGTATSVFGSSQPGSFGATAPSFGASTSTPFGSTQFGGTSVFGQKPASPFGSFGTTSPSQGNPFGTPAFGQTQSAFGNQNFGTSPAFGASTPAFGSTATPAFGTTTGAFAATSTPAFGATATPAFGSSTPAFGNTTPGFGQSAPAFGASTSSAFGSTPVFGAGSTSPFGVQSASAFGAATTSPTFGSSAFGATAFGGRVGSRMSPYAATNDPESSVGQVGKFMSISAMPVYKNKSPEELRWEDYQAKDKGGPNSTAQPVPAGSIFGVTQPTAPANPFGGSTHFGQTSTQNPFASASTPSLFAPSIPQFGASTTPAFGTGATSFGANFGSGTSPFASQPLATGFGASSSPAFGISGGPFGASSPAFSSGAFGASTAFGSSIFSSSSSSAFGPSPNITFGASSSTPNFTSSQGFGGGLFGGQSSPSIFLGSSTPAFGVSSPAFGGASGSSFGMASFSNPTPSSIFSQSKAAGLASSSPSSLLGPFGTPGPTSGALSFPQNFAVTPQPGGSIFGGGSPAPPFGATTFNQQPLQTASPVPVSNPFGTLPAMPQMSIARSAGTGPSVQYGISSMPVSDKPAQVRTTSLLTPRHVTQRSKVRLHARRYHPKKDSPKVSFFSDGEEAVSTPKADVLFVARENPRALFIRPPDQPHATPSGPAKYGADAREIATPLQRTRFESQETEVTNGESPQASWPSPDTDATLQTSVVPPKFQKSGTKQNGVRDEHAPRGNGYISITGHRAGEAAIAYEHGADIEALMPKLRHSDYYTEPRIQELAAKERAEPGYCRRVMDFVVGRRQYGSVKFLGETDIRRLDLEGIVQFNKCEVLVYMDESKKPPVGQGLNKPAEVTLLNVKCVDKRTGQQYMEGLEADKFEKKLKRKTEEQGAEFISYDSLKGEWTFRVKHFSRYGLDESDEEESSGIDQKDAADLAENELMEGVEGFHRSLGHDRAQLPDMTNVTSDEVEVAEEYEFEEMRTSSIQSALPHSLPLQLRLDPVKMHQMRSLFFPFEDLEDVVKPGWSSKSGAETLRTSKLRHHAEEGSLPHILGRTSGKRISQTAWKQATLSDLDLQKSTKLPAYKVLPESPPFVSAACPLSLAGTGRSSTVKRPRHSGFNLEARPNVHGKFNHVSDAALFLGSSFRVGWGPHGLLAHSGKLVGSLNIDVGLSSCIHVEKVALDRTARDKQGNMQAELVDSQFVSPLSIHLSMSQTVPVSLEQHAVTLRRLICTKKELAGVCAEYEKIAKQQQSFDGISPEDSLVLQHHITVWQLISVLFSERPEIQGSVVINDDGSENGKNSESKSSAIDTEAEGLVRRAKFSSWLQDSVGHLLVHDLQCSEKVDFQKLFILLTARQLDDAVEKAISTGNVRMAILLSQAGGSLLNREDISVQLDLWAREGADESAVDVENVRVFKLLAGDLQSALGTSSIDWKRYLGLLMWYQLAPDTELTKIISKYRQDVDHGEAPYPIPMYLEDNGVKVVQPSMCFDCNYYLLLLHAELVENSCVAKMLSCGSSTFDRLDHRLAWCQQNILQAVGVLDFPQVHALYMNFVAQLLAVGLCHWAVYVVLHMPYTVEQNHLHEKVVREILFQYCETWSNSEQQKSFLVRDISIPLIWLHEAQAIYWQYVGDSSKALKHFVKSCQWHAAHTMFMSKVSAIWFTNGNHALVWKYATKLEDHKTEIENWGLGAGIFIEFYALKNHLENVMEPSNNETLQIAAGLTKVFLGRLDESRSVWLPRSLADTSVAYAKMADTVASLLLQKSAVQCVSSTVELNLYEAIMEAPEPEDARLCRVQGAASAFSSWLLKDVTV